MDAKDSHNDIEAQNPMQTTSTNASDNVQSIHNTLANIHPTRPTIESDGLHSNDDEFLGSVSSSATGSTLERMVL